VRRVRDYDEPDVISSAPRQLGICPSVGQRDVPIVHSMEQKLRHSDRQQVTR
jgi:hypothetical protein